MTSAGARDVVVADAFAVGQDDTGTVVVSVTGPPTDGSAQDVAMPDTKDDAGDAADASSIADARAGIDTSTDAAEIGAVAIVSGTPFALAVEGNLAYVGDWGGPSKGTLSIIDVSVPAHPRIVGSYTDEAEIQGLAIRNGRAYLANDTVGLAMVDVSQPEHPSYVCERAEPSGPSYGHAVTAGDFGTNPKPYVMMGGFYGAALNIYDLTRPNALGDPIVYKSPTTWARDILDVIAAGNTGYVLIGDGDPRMRVEVIDLGVLPTSPVQLGGVSLPVATYGSWGKIRIAGSTLYVATSMHTTHVGGLRVIDVSDPRSPHVVGGLDIQDIGHVAWEGVGLDVAGSRVYILGRTALHILDVSNPRKPVEAVALPLPAEYVNDTGGNVVVAGDYAYATVSSAGTEGGGLVVFRIAGIAGR